MNRMIDDSVLTDIADAIREKNGTDNKYKDIEMAQAIVDIPSPKTEQEKLVDITQNGTTEVVPDDGKTLSKVTINVDVETSSSDIYYDIYWDANQQKGKRIHYGSAYSSPTSNMLIWTDENFMPKYDMRPTTIASMFGYSDIEDIKGIFEKMGRVFDTSNCTDFTQAFRGSAIIYPPDLDLSKAPHLNGTFNSCKKVKAITLKNVQSTMTYVNNPFRDCEQLTDFAIEGIIGSTVSFANSSLLSTESIDNIIGCLADLTGQIAQTITLHAEVKAQLTEEQISAITSKNWTLA